MSSPTPQEETRALLDLHQGDTVSALRFVQGQMDTIYGRSQALIGLASVTLTVTGFSGRLIAGTNLAAQVFLIAGLAVVLSSALYLVLRVLPIRWITKDLVKSPEHTLCQAIRRRDEKTSAIHRGGLVLLLGLFLYLIAVAIMLLHPAPLSVPVR